MGEIVAGVTVMQKFCLSGSKKYKSYIDYLDREETKRNDVISQYNLYNDYMGNPIKTTGLFTSDKNNLSEQEKGAIKKVFKTAQDNGSVMWQTVISFDNRWLEENHIYDSQTKMLDERKLKDVAKLGINRMLEKENLEHAVWSAAIHYNTDNIHIHVASVEPVPMRKMIAHDGEMEYKGKFRMDSIELCKSSVVNEIVSSKEINRMINKIIRKDIVEMKKERELANDPEIRKQFLNLYESLPNIPKNMMNYNNSIMKPCRSLVDDISRYYIDRYHKDDYQRLSEILSRQSNLYRKAYGDSKRDYQIDKEADLMTRLGNAILKEVRNFNPGNRNLDISEEMPDQNVDNAVTQEAENYVLNLAHDNLAEELENMERYFQDYENELSARKSRIDDQNWKHNYEESKKLQSRNEEQTKYRQQGVEERYKEWFVEYKKIKELLYPGRKQKPNHKLAFEMCTKNGNENPIILATLADLYAKGLGAEINIEKAQETYQAALHIFLSDEKQKFVPADRFDLHSYITYRIGKQFNYGMGVEKNYEEAAKWFEKSGSIYAKFQLANLFHSGNGVEKDYEKAFELYQKATDMPYAAYKLGLMCEKGQGVQQNSERAQSYYKQAFQGFMRQEKKQPDDKLEYRLGSMLYAGKGCDQDIGLAKEYLTHAMESKNVYASYKLALIYLDEGEEENISMAVSILKELSVQDYEMAQYTLGKIYTDKNYSNYNLVEGIKQFSKAAEQGNSFAQYRLGKLYLNQEETVYDLYKGIGYMEQAAAQENEYAQYQLGKLYLDQTKEVYDLHKGIRYMTQAAEQGNEYAQYQLGKLYVNSQQPFFDIWKGEQYLKQAMEQGNSFAKFQLGKIYLDTECELHNSGKGIQYMMELGEDGNEYAQMKMGYEYLKGANITRNIESAREWFTKASEQGNEQAKDILANLSEGTGSRSGRGRGMPALDKALVQLKKTLNEEYRNSMENIREYERDLRLGENQEELIV